MYSNFEIETCLNSMKIVIDTREKITEEYNRRIEDIEYTCLQKKLQYGDYSCTTILPNGEVLDFSNKIVIERKQNLDEIIQNFLDKKSKREENGIVKNRFERELIKAKQDNCKIYLLIENATWEHVFSGRYRSKIHPNAFIAFLLAYTIRYDLRVLFCKEETTGKLIKNILYREVKEYLETLKEGE